MGETKTWEAALDGQGHVVAGLRSHKSGEMVGGSPEYVQG